MPRYRCPKCGNAGEPGVPEQPTPYGFDMRGRLQNKHVFKCCECGAGLLRRGIFSNKLTLIPADTWTEMERQWGDELRAQSAVSNAGNAVTPQELAVVLAELIHRWVESDREGKVAEAVKQLPDYADGTSDLELFVLYLAAQQMAVQSDDRLRPYAVPLNGTITQYYAEECLEASADAKARSESLAEEGIEIDPRHIMLGRIDEIGAKRIPGYVDCINRFSGGQMAAGMKLFGLDPVNSLALFITLNEAMLAYKELLSEVELEEQQAPTPASSPAEALDGADMRAAILEETCGRLFDVLPGYNVLPDYDTEDGIPTIVLRGPKPENLKTFEFCVQRVLEEAPAFFRYRWDFSSD